MDGALMCVKHLKKKSLWIISNQEVNFKELQNSQNLKKYI
jgi:hypothetical protein